MLSVGRWLNIRKITYSRHNRFEAYCATNNITSKAQVTSEFFGRLSADRATHYAPAFFIDYCVSKTYRQTKPPTSPLWLDLK